MFTLPPVSYLISLSLGLVRYVVALRPLLTQVSSWKWREGFWRQCSLRAVQCALSPCARSAVQADFCSIGVTITATTDSYRRMIIYFGVLVRFHIPSLHSFTYKHVYYSIIVFLHPFEDLHVGLYFKLQY